MIFNIHAGHNPSGRVGCGAVGILNESVENRKIKNNVILQLRGLGNTAYDCTVDDGTSQNDILARIVQKCNAHDVDLDVSIHFNAGGGNGVEVYTYSATNNDIANGAAFRICSEISALGFRNRGVKYNKELYVLKHTKAPAILIECCFVDSQTDANIYNADKMADAIVQAIAGTTYREEPKPSQPTKYDTSVKIDSAKKFHKGVAGKYKTVANLNMRTGAGTSETIICTIPKGSNVVCYGYYTTVNGVNWLVVEYNGSVGFCSSSYLQ